MSATAPAAGDPAGKRPWVVHPLLVAAFPALSLYAHNVYETPAGAMLGPLAIAEAGAVALWLVVALLARDAARAGLFTSLLAALFFGFERWNAKLDEVVTRLSNFWVYGVYHVTLPWALASMAPALAAGAWLIFRRIGATSRWTSALNAFGAILVAMPVGSIAMARLREPGAPPSRAIDAKAVARGERPDIYYIILDGYARQDVMKERFGFDNGPFLRRLEAKGFYVASRSTSNYCQTRLSLASSLNFNYLDALIDPSSRDPNPLSERVADNAVIRALRPLGYRFLALSSGYEPTECTTADEFLAPSFPRRAFHRFFAGMTPLGPVLYPGDHADYFTRHRERILFNLARLAEIPESPGPKFVFAHFVCPHHPFCFGEHGEDISPHIVPKRDHTASGREYDGVEGYRRGYRQQAVYITGQIESVVDAILARSATPPVIILQSDHGSGLYHDLESLEKTDVRERFGNLTVVYFPDRDYAGLDEEITPVNLFRVVLDKYFDAGLPKLPRRNFYSPLSDPLECTDVTGRVHGDRPGG